MELIMRELDEDVKVYLLSEIDKLNKEFRLNFDAVCILDRERVRVNFVGKLNGVPRYFKVSARNYEALPRLIKERYKSFKKNTLEKSFKQNEKSNTEKLELPKSSREDRFMEPKSLNIDKKNNCKIIIVDDDFDAVSPVDKAVKSITSNVSYCMSGADALEAVPVLQPDLIVLDWHLGDSNAGAVLESLDKVLMEQDAKPIKLVTYSALEKEKINLKKFVKFDLLDHWCKPISIDEMKERLLVVMNQIDLVSR